MIDSKLELYKRQYEALIKGISKDDFFNSSFIEAMLRANLSKSQKSYLAERCYWAISEDKANDTLFHGFVGAIISNGLHYHWGMGHYESVTQFVGAINYNTEIYSTITDSDTRKVAGADKEVHEWCFAKTMKFLRSYGEILTAEFGIKQDDIGAYIEKMKDPKNVLGVERITGFSVDEWNDLKTKHRDNAFSR